MYSEELMVLIQSILIKDQNKRPSVADIFQNPFFDMHYKRFKEEQKNSEKLNNIFIVDNFMA
jgi:hypothetical protein